MSDTTEIPLTVNTTPNNLTIVTLPTSLKLSSTNYLGWKTQIEALLHGLDLYKFIDGSHPPPSQTIMTGNVTTPNKEYLNWFRQDRLLFGALIGSLSPPIIPVVTNAKSSLEAWQTLATTYASPSRGHIKQLQHRLKQCTKTPTQAVSDYLQTIKTIVDELSILGKKMDPEDVTDIILNGLDQETYKPTIDAIHARDTPISFNELHEKLINQELTLAQTAATNTNLHQPVSAFMAHGRNSNRSWTGRNSSSHSFQRNPSSQRNPNVLTAHLLPTPQTTSLPPNSSRPFLGKC